MAAFGLKAARHPRRSRRRGRLAAMRPASHGTGSGRMRLAQTGESLRGLGARFAARTMELERERCPRASNASSSAVAISRSAPSQETVRAGIESKDSRSVGSKAGGRKIRQDGLDPIELRRRDARRARRRRGARDISASGSARHEEPLELARSSYECSRRERERRESSAGPVLVALPDLSLRPRCGPGRGVT